MKEHMMSDERSEVEAAKAAEEARRATSAQQNPQEQRAQDARGGVQSDPTRLADDAKLGREADAVAAGDEARAAQADELSEDDDDEE